MPTLAAESKWANIERSLAAYIAAELVTAAGFTVRFPGEPGIQNPPVRWVEVDYVQIGPVEGIMQTLTGKGHRSEVVLQLAHFEQIDARWDGSGTATLYSLTEMLDTTRASFAFEAIIPLRDYDTGGNPQVGAFQLYEMPREVGVVTPPELRIEQRTLAVPLRYNLDVT